MPPGGRGGRWEGGVSGGERGDEVGNDGSLRRGQAAIEEEVDGVIALEEAVSVVLQNKGLLLH